MKDRHNLDLGEMTPIVREGAVMENGSPLFIYSYETASHYI